MNENPRTCYKQQHKRRAFPGGLAATRFRLRSGKSPRAKERLSLRTMVTACALEPGDRLQLSSPRALGPGLRSKRSPRNRSLCTATKSKPAPHSERAAHTARETPHSQEETHDQREKTATLPTSIHLDSRT